MRSTPKPSSIHHFRTHQYRVFLAEPYFKLDLEDEILEKLDQVLAAVHTRFTQTGKEMTRRIIRAIEHPNVHVIAHPTGRLIGKREAYALDMEKGRARIPFNMGEVNIHSVSALAIDSVNIEKGKKKGKPVVIRIKMLNSAGIFQIDELLKRKLENNPVKQYVSVIVETPREEKKIVDRMELKWD